MVPVVEKSADGDVWAKNGRNVKMINKIRTIRMQEEPADALKLFLVETTVYIHQEPQNNQLLVME